MQTPATRERMPPGTGGAAATRSRRVRRRLPSGLSALGHRDYRIFWFTQLISLTGTWMQSLAQSWLVLTLTNSPAALGLVGVFQFAPSLILGIPAGVLVDRLPKRRLLQFTQLSFAVITGALAILVATGRVQAWHIYVAALALGVVSSIDMPTRQAFVVDLVGREDLMNAIALNSAVFNTSRVVGPALAGLALAAFGPTLPFVLNALSYVPVVIGLTLMHTAGLPTGDADIDSALARLRQGLAYVRRTPDVLLPIVLVGLISTFGMNFSVWAPLIARDALDIGASGFGMLMSALGIGSLTGALTLAFGGRRPSHRVMLVTALLFGAFEIGLGIAAGLGGPAIVAMVLMAGTGFAMSMTTAQANTTVQTNSPDALRGRVMSIYVTVSSGSVPFGAALAGFMSDVWGAPVAVTVGGAVVVLAALAIGGQVVRMERAGYRLGATETAD